MENPNTNSSNLPNMEPTKNSNSLTKHIIKITVGVSLSIAILSVGYWYMVLRGGVFNEPTMSTPETKITTNTTNPKENKELNIDKIDDIHLEIPSEINSNIQEFSPNTENDDLLNQLRHITDSYQQNIIIPALLCRNANNDLDLIEHLPPSTQKEYELERSEIQEEMQGYIDDGDMTEEEVKASLSRCYNYIQKEDWDFIEKTMKRDADGDGLNLYLEFLEHGDDNKKDTDGDGYDDLTEFESGNKVNDNWTEEKTLILKKVNSMLEENSPDLVKIKNACMELGSNRDECLKNLYWYAEDTSFCNDIPLYMGYRYDTSCQDIILGRKAYMENNTATCLDLENDRQINVCLAEHAKIKQSLEPCTLNNSFDQCVQIKNVFTSLTSSQQCIDNVDKFTSSVSFNSCIYDSTYKDKKIENCYYLSGIPPYQCIKLILDSDQNICENYEGAWDKEKQKCLTVNDKLFKAYLGVFQETLTPEAAEDMKINYVQGSYIAYVTPMSLAEEIGLQVGDIITQIDIHIINERNSLTDILSQYTSEDKATLNVWSENKYKKIEVDFWTLSEGLEKMYLPQDY